MALLISAFSLPADIKNKTITTVVTKPVRTAEIVLGRIVGFTLIGSALLAVMGLASYVFVVRSLAHTHEIWTDDINLAALRSGAFKTGKDWHDADGAESSARHYFEGRRVYLETDFKNGHKHSITVKEVDGKTSFTLRSARRHADGAGADLLGICSFRSRRPAEGKGH